VSANERIKTTDLGTPLHCRDGNDQVYEFDEDRHMYAFLLPPNDHAQPRRGPPRRQAPKSRHAPAVDLVRTFQLEPAPTPGTEKRNG
jgi:hypothetical protein